MSTGWAPASLPDGLTPQKALVRDDSIIVLGFDGNRSALFVRTRGRTEVSRVLLDEATQVKDFTVLPTLGVFLLVAKMTTEPGRTTWDDFEVLQLLDDLRTVRRVYSGARWDERGASFPLALLGSSADGRHLALACGQHRVRGEADALDYRLGFLDPTSGKLELAEELAGFIY